MSEKTNCPPDESRNYTTLLIGQTVVPEWETFLTIVTLTFIILLIIVGNVMVILSVFTYKPLRIVQNFFIVSLAVADLTVAILVLPLNVIYSILGRWVFGIHVCKMWLTSDVMCCTASILNLCAIALDRFWAITDPINYAQKRTLKRVLLMIGGVWLLSLLISSPPLLGWNDWPDADVFLKVQECKLTERRGYVIYSSLGSFCIPLLIMTIVYVEIFIATKRRLRERAQASRINAISRNQSVVAVTSNNKGGATEDRDSVSSEAANNEPKKSDTSNNSAGHLLLHKGDDSFEEAATAATASTKCETAVVVVGGGAAPSVVTKCASLASGGGGGAVYQFIEEKQRISLSKERRAARTLGIIMGVFVVCWLPFFLMYVIIPFCTTCCPSRRLINFITWLGYINSALNPIIYTIFNLDYRRAFRRLLGLH